MGVECQRKRPLHPTKVQRPPSSGDEPAIPSEGKCLVFEQRIERVLSVRQGSAQICIGGICVEGSLRCLHGILSIFESLFSDRILRLWFGRCLHDRRTANGGHVGDYATGDDCAGAVGEIHGAVRVRLGDFEEQRLFACLVIEGCFLPW